MDVRKYLGLQALCLIGLAFGAAFAQTPSPGTPPPDDTDQPVLTLGIGDQVKMTVFGRPEMDSTMYVASDGTIRVPLAGTVYVEGLSPVQAAERVEAALRRGEFLRHPHVTLSLVDSLTQKVSVLGEVRNPGRYPIESTSTVIDVLAQAGGATEKGADVVYLLRETPSGTINRYPIDLRGLASATGAMPDAVAFKLHGGDRIYVPPAPLFYISGEVNKPAAYRLDSDTTVLQAIATAGGVTDRGSTHRIQIRRRTANGYIVLHPKLTDLVKPDDVITVKERIF